MPAVRRRKVKSTTIAEGEYAGLVVQTNSLSLGEFEEKFLAGAASAEKSGDAEEFGFKIVLEFAEVLIGWDMTDEDGAPVPATLAGLRTLDVEDAIGIVNQWVTAMADVPAPLDRPSSGGGRYPEVSIPMTLPEESSPSLPHWLAQK